jgi:hypothetical protein
MYSATLVIHSWMRWAVVVLALLALARRGRYGLFFTIALDIQFLIGLALYLFISPNTRAALANAGAAMHIAATRFWIVEHPFAMVLALVFAHIGRVKPARQGLFFGLALLFILLGMPWPGLLYGRPLFRL